MECLKADQYSYHGIWHIIPEEIRNLNNLLKLISLSSLQAVGKSQNIMKKKKKTVIIKHCEIFISRFVLRIFWASAFPYILSFFSIWNNVLFVNHISSRNWWSSIRFGWSAGPEKLVWYGIYCSFKLLQGLKIKEVYILFLGCIKYFLFSIQASFDISVIWHFFFCSVNWREFSLLCH